MATLGSGRPRVEVDIKELSNLSRYNNSGAINTSIIAQRGVIGKVYSLRTFAEAEKYFGDNLENNTDLYHIKTALSLGAVMNTARLGHYADITDPSTLQGTKATASVTTGGRTGERAEAIFSVDAIQTGEKITEVNVNGSDILGTDVSFNTNVETTVAALVAQLASDNATWEFAVVTGDTSKFSVKPPIGSEWNDVSLSMAGDGNFGYSVTQQMTGGVDTIATSTNVIEAEEVGTGYNGITAEFVFASSGKTGYVDLNVTLPNTNEVIAYKDIKASPTTAEITEINENLDFIKIVSVSANLYFTTATLATGAQDITQITDDDQAGYKTSKNGWFAFDDTGDAMRFANISFNNKKADKALVDYVVSRKDARAQLFVPKGLNITQVENYIKGEGAYAGYPINTYYASIRYLNCAYYDIVKGSKVNDSAKGEFLGKRSSIDQNANLGVWRTTMGSELGIFSTPISIPINFDSSGNQEIYNVLNDLGLNAMVQDEDKNFLDWGARTYSKNKESLLFQETAADTTIFIARELKRIMKPFIGQPLDLDALKKAYNKVRPWIVNILVNKRAIAGINQANEGEGVNWFWKGDQEASTYNDLTVNTANELDQGIMKAQFVFKPVGAVYYIGLTVSPSDTVTVEKLASLQ